MAIVLNNFKEQLLLKTIDCNSDTFKIALYDVALASPDGADIAYTTTDEIDEGGAIAGYTTAGQSVGVCVVTQDDGNNLAKWDDDGTDVTWANLGAAAIAEARLYDDTTATKWVCILWEIDTASNGANYTLAFNAGGMLTIS